MSEHTKEPWFFSEWSDELVPIRTKSGRIVCDVGYADTDQINIFNARRIVACVNACAGIPTGMLEAAGQSAVIALRPVDELVAERNALLAALVKIKGLWSGYAKCSTYASYLIAIDAIAKVKP